MSVWITRSAPDNLRTARALRELGRKPLMVPVLTTRPLPQPPLQSLPDAIVFTSVHAVRHHPRDDRLLWVPVFAASGLVADAATAAGYATVTSTGGNEAALPVLMGHILPTGARVVIFCADRTSPILTERLCALGHHVARRAVYEPMPARDDALEQALRRLGRVSAVVVHSRCAAERIAPVLRGIDWRGSLWCISDHAAGGLAGLDHACVRVAPQPTEAALLAMIARDAPGMRPRRSPTRSADIRNPLAALRTKRRTERSAAHNDNGPCWPMPDDDPPAA